MWLLFVLIFFTSRIYWILDEILRRFCSFSQHPPHKFTHIMTIWRRQPFLFNWILVILHMNSIEYDEAEKETYRQIKSQHLSNYKNSENDPCVCCYVKNQEKAKWEIIFPGIIFNKFKNRLWIHASVDLARICECKWDEINMNNFSKF